MVEERRILEVCRTLGALLREPATCSPRRRPTPVRLEGTQHPVFSIRLAPDRDHVEPAADRLDGHVH